jgi:hypothetical protein
VTTPDRDRDLAHAAPALHPRLRGGAAVATLAAAWRDGGALRIDELLDPGLAAELAVELPRLPLAPRVLAEHEDLSWACEVGVPDDPDPQLAACMHRLAALLDTELPALAGAITGRRLAPPARRRVHVWAFRKGGHVAAGRPLAPPGGLDVWIGLTGARWPAELGGHVDRVDAGGSAAITHAPGWDTLDLIDGLGHRIALVCAHVEALWVRSYLVPGA